MGLAWRDRGISVMGRDLECAVAGSGASHPESAVAAARWGVKASAVKSIESVNERGHVFKH